MRTHDSIVFWVTCESLDWHLIDLTCEETADQNTTTDLGAATAYPELDAGETIICTFTNQKEAAALVHKQTHPDGDPERFTFTGDLAGDIADGSQLVMVTDTPGTYDATEVLPSGWVFDGITCDDPDGGTTTAGKTAHLDIDPGEIVQCTFENSKLGTIIVEKQTLPDGHAKAFTFTGKVPGSIADGEQLTKTGVAPGAYDVIETVPGGWDLTAIVCEDPTDDSTVHLADKKARVRLGTGETVKCTFYNEKEAEPIPEPEIQVIYTVDPTDVVEPGGMVYFSVKVKNLGVLPVTLTSLTDTDYGNLDGVGSCSLPKTIAAGSHYTCGFDAHISGAPGDSHHVTATAKAKDTHGQQASDSDGATVTVVDGPSSIAVSKAAFPIEVAEPGADVVFTVGVQNTSPGDSVTIESVIDDVFGDVSASCDLALPAELASGETMNCVFSEFIAGQPGDVHEDIITVSGTDDDGIPVGGEASSQVTILDVPSSVLITKTADPASVEEPGGDVTFTVVVENTSAVDDVTVESVLDDMYGDVGASCDMPLPALLAPGESLTCVFTGAVTGQEGDTHTNVVTVTVTDDDGVTYTGTGQTTVPIDEAPAEVFRVYLPIASANSED
jgi:hypothetical protein